MNNMADYDYKSRANERTDRHRCHPATVTRNFVFGCGRDRNHGKHKVEAHRVPELYSNVQANTNRNTYGGFEGSNNSKLSVSDQALIDLDGGVRPNRVSEPALIDSDGWVRPSRTGWSMPPEVPLSKVTRNIDAAADYVRGTARPQYVDAAADYTRGSARPQSSEVDQWSSAASSPYLARRTTGTIDSKQAARKYGGQFHW